MHEDMKKIRSKRITTKHTSFVERQVAEKIKQKNRNYNYQSLEWLPFK